MKTQIALAPFVFLLVVACAATQPPAPAVAPPPVTVVVTADPSLASLVDTAALTAATQEALRRFAANAPACVVDVRFVSVDTAIDITSYPTAFGFAEPVNYGHVVPILSPEPYNEGTRPVVGNSGGFMFGVQPHGTRMIVQGRYTITDQRGVVLERKRIHIDAGIGGTNNAQWAAGYLAKRVAKVTRRSS